jgi:hypothetical protein
MQEWPIGTSLIVTLWVCSLGSAGNTTGWDHASLRDEFELSKCRILFFNKAIMYEKQQFISLRFFFFLEEYIGASLRASGLGRAVLLNNSNPVTGQLPQFIHFFTVKES